LLAAGIDCQIGKLQASGEIGMGVDQRQLLLAGRFRERIDHGGMKPLRRILPRGQPGVICALRDPGRMLEDVAKEFDEYHPIHAAGLQIRRMMMANPMVGDVDAPCHPDILMGTDVIQEPGQSRGASGAAGEAAMEADRHHLRRSFAFCVQRVEAVLEIGEELVARIEALRGRKAHVVGIQRIGHDQLLPVAMLFPIRQIVRVGIGAVEKAALLRHEAVRVLRGAARIPA
jgi:hypothetical protein